MITQGGLTPAGKTCLSAEAESLVGKSPKPRLWREEELKANARSPPEADKLPRSPANSGAHSPSLSFAFKENF